MLSVQPAFARTVYYDTFNHWAESDIEFASNTLKVFNGYGDFTFRPESNITRAEFITILCRTAYKHNWMNEVYTSDMKYKDMSMDHWSYTYVISMYEYLKTNQDYSLYDIFTGENFDPDNPITREEATALIAAFSKISIYDNPISFKDLSIDNKYYNQIKTLSNAGVIKGYEDNTFRPYIQISRAESAALIKRVYQDLKTSNSKNYLNKLEFMSMPDDDIYLNFGKYDTNTINVMDRKYLKAKETLEYISFGGYIFPEDEHLYDLNAFETLFELKRAGYKNIAGTNYYLISFGSFSDEEKTTMANEILSDIASRGDLLDSELMQLFTITMKYNTDETLFLNGLKKWYDLTLSENAKANILFFRYAYYIKNKKPETLRTLVFNDLTKEKNLQSLLALDLGSLPKMDVDFNNYNFNEYVFELYDHDSYLTSAGIVDTNLKITKLNKLYLVEKKEKPSLDINSYAAFYSKYSVNRLYVLNFIGEKERAFVEALNDYEKIKQTAMYQKSKTSIDDIYTGILKKVKE